MPWFEYYPKPGQARGVQIDMKPDRIGLRYPVEIGLIGDAKATLAALIPLLQRQSDRSKACKRAAGTAVEPPAGRDRNEPRVRLYGRRW